MTPEPNTPKSEGSTPERASETPSAPAGTPPGQHAAAAVDAGEGAVPETAEARIAKLEEEIATVNDRWVRAVAEMENMRKRAEREKSETAKYAITRFAQDVVTVGDNFQRAIAAVPAGAADSDPALKSLIEGVAVTEREFLNVLERHGVKRIEPHSEAFNPHLHQAVMEQQNADVPAGTVLQVLQSGYVIEDRVLRPAMVVVAQGGPKPVKSESAARPAAEAPQGAESGEGSASTSDKTSGDKSRAANNNDPSPEGEA